MKYTFHATATKKSIMSKTIWYCPDCEKATNDQRFKKCPFCGGKNMEDEDGRLLAFVEGTALEGAEISDIISAYNRAS